MTVTARRDGRWRALCLSEEVGRDNPVARRTVDRDYVLFRDAAGVIRVLIDQCVHRRAPLSLGRMTSDGLIQCPYHGWTYDGTSGICKRIPNLSRDERLPERYRVETFAAVERNGFVYVWSGAADLADEAALPFPAAPTWIESWTDSRLLTIPQPVFIQTLLDAPSVVLRVNGLHILDGFTLGDPCATSGLVTAEYGVDSRRWPRPGHPLPVDVPMTLQVAASRDGTVLAELKSDVGEVIAATLIAIAPASDAVTATLSRGACARDSRNLRIAVHDRIDAAALLAVKPHAGRLWATVADGDLTAAA